LPLGVFALTAVSRLNGVKPLIETNPAAVNPIPHPLRPAEATKHEYAREYP
jgi:hypothetical protein